VSEAANLNTQISTVMADVPKGTIGVAISGGGDSVALLRLLCNWGQERGRKVYAATVNHNLRSEAQAEASFVARLCRDLNVPHRILNWENWDGQGNLQNAARNARKSLLTDWAQELDIATVALGHTRDDQAETFLMRIARGSGVDGLSGIKQIKGKCPVWVRPLLGIARSDLRRYLIKSKQDWVEDPSNDDDNFERIKIRKAMPELAKLGLSVDRLASTAESLQLSRAALENLTQNVVRRCCEPNRFGTVLIDLKELQSEPLEIQYRVLCYAMAWVNGTHYRPRFSALKMIYRLLRQGKSQTLAGCFIKVIGSKQVIVMREIANMKPEPVSQGCFDGRWQVSIDQNLEGAEIRPLGEKGILQVKNWRNLDISRDILLQTPAAWLGNSVSSAPFAGFNGLVEISLKNDLEQFYYDVVSR
jgi:tRNA(Ile)-lysidine synthase